MTLVSVARLTKRFPVVAPPSATSWAARHNWFRAGRRTGQTFTALDEVSFEIRSGDVVAILGRNGAGKSTLLKILSRIMRPDQGRVVLHGRVGSLLEVGTGFHPDLTGRENIFLNGAILGLNEREIRARFDAIVDFAEVDHALDAPVSTYSSGMYMRLAFAVAAHVDPEILFVDEVLAVGDAAFQRKCLQRLERLGRAGQAVLFVSHNPAAVARLCNRAILLEQGKVIADGTVADALDRYLAREDAADAPTDAGPETAGDEVVRITGVCFRNASQAKVSTASVGEQLDVEIAYDVLTDGVPLFPALTLTNDWEVPILWAMDASNHGQPEPKVRGRYRARVVLPPHLLPDGLLRAGVTIVSHPLREHARATDAARIVMTDTERDASTRAGYPGTVPSAVRPRLDWVETFTPDDPR